MVQPIGWTGVCDVSKELSLSRLWRSFDRWCNELHKPLLDLGPCLASNRHALFLLACQIKVYTAVLRPAGRLAKILVVSVVK